jgi:drug/metabolite transporter (DMT)-like permease
LENLKMQRIKGSVFLFCAFTLAGTSVISAKFVSGRLGVFTIAAASLLFAILCLLPLCANILIKTIRLMEKREWLMLFLQALFGIFLFRMFLLQGLLRTSAGEAGILTGATPAVTALLAMVILKEPASVKSLAGILSTVGGILLIQGALSPGNEFLPENFWGNMLVLCAAGSESLFNMFSRMNYLKAASRQKEPFNPVVQTMLVSGIALLLCIIPALFEQPVSSLMALGIKEWLSLIWYGVFVTALAFIFWYAGIKRRSVYAAAAFSGMMPFTSLFLSVMVLGEQAGWWQWSGGALIILGMFLIGKREACNALLQKPETV